MECAGQGTLQARIATEGPFGEEQARCAFAQLSLALNHMVRNSPHHNYDMPTSNDAIAVL